MPEISLTQEQIYDMGEFSGGHPYLMQLVGDALYQQVKRVYDPFGTMVVEPTAQDIAEAEHAALIPYKRNVLDDVLAGTHAATREYIETAHSLRDETGLIATADVNAKLGGSAASLASRRMNAINTQVIRPVRRGYLRFALPHFEYAYRLLEDDRMSPDEDEWEY